MHFDLCVALTAGNICDALGSNVSHERPGCTCDAMLQPHTYFTEHVPRDKGPFLGYLTRDFVP